MNAKPKRGFAILLIWGAFATLILKFVAFRLSSSVGIFSDAVESLVNLSAAFFALFALSYASKPADTEHAYGHEKIEFFASGLEGSLIVVAAIWIVYEATTRFLHPEPLFRLPLSLGISVFAALINAVIAKLLSKAANIHDSIILEASAKHLLADVWTTLAVAIGLGLFLLTKDVWIDPLLALLVGCNVIWSGIRLVLRSFEGLMDRALPESELQKIREIINRHLGTGWKFHALRTRKSGARRFVDFHLLMPGGFSLKKSHEITLAIEKELEKKFETTDVTIHMEPLEDPKSWEEDSISRRVKNDSIP